MTALVLALTGLVIGPLVEALGARVRALHDGIDGFALMVVAGVSLGAVLPEVFGELGLLGLGLLALGALLPARTHRAGQRGTWPLGVLLLALTVHAGLDGALLSQSGDAPLAWAIVAHRLPVGFAVVLAVRGSERPLGLAWFVVGVLSASTLAGYVGGPWVVAQLPEWAPTALEALVAGALMHVVFSPEGLAREARRHSDAHAHDHGREKGHDHDHHGPGHDHHHHHHDDDQACGDCGPVPPARAASHRFATLGVGLGALALVLFGGLESHGHGDHGGATASFTSTLATLILQSAPALVLGYALAGMVPLLITPTRTSQLARGGRVTQALRGVAFGLPLPICSCGVLPLYESIIRKGVPATAALAFFVATPELGLDAVLLSVPLLGGDMAIARVVTAFAVALLVALLVGRGVSRRTVSDFEEQAASMPQTWGERLQAGLRFGFVEVFDHTMPWVVFGLVLAALAEPLITHGLIEALPSVAQVPLAALVGVPVYVCASGATPIAALAIHKGLSAGAAMAFLIAGPATNVTTFGVLARLHGTRMALVFGVAVTSFAVVAGWLVDLLGVTAVPVLEAGGAVEGAWWSQVCVLLLGVLVLASLLRQGPRGALRQIYEPIHAH